MSRTGPRWGILQPSLVCLVRGGSRRDTHSQDLNPRGWERPSSTSLGEMVDEEGFDGSGCAPGNSLVLIQSTDKQLHRDSVNHQGVLVSWTSWWQGQTRGRKASSKCWRCTPEHPAFCTIVGFGWCRWLLFALLLGDAEVSGGMVPVLLARCVPEPSALVMSGRAPGKLCRDGGCLLAGRDGLSVPGFAGTPGYLSPEVLRKDPYGKAVDLWACGKSDWG